jgi:hypothetical protein
VCYLGLGFQKSHLQFAKIVNFRQQVRPFLRNPQLTENQQVTNGIPKGRLLGCKRPSFAR